jgi:hypothetical protein
MLWDEALALLLHVRHGKAILNTHWTKAPEFTDVYEQWVERLGSTPWAIHTLLRFLSGPGIHLEPKFVVKLLAHASQRVAAREERDSIWREDDVGRETAQALATIWEGAGQHVRDDETCMRQFVAILDELSRAGIPLAATLRQTI